VSKGKSDHEASEPLTEGTGEIRISLDTLGRVGDFGALAHYADAAYYTQCYRSRKHDVEYYVRLGQECTGAVLEFGCGNGRVTLAMAQAGANVCGVDLSRPMLDDFERRLQKAPRPVRDRIRLVQGDMRDIDVGHRFALVVAPFNVMLHLYAASDIERFFRNVISHLQPGGQFVCDVSLPLVADLARDPDRRFRAPSFVHPQTKQKIDYSERFEYDPIRQLLLIWMEFIPKDGSPPWTIPLTHRQIFPCELEAHLRHAGFSSFRITSDFTDEPASSHTDSMVVTCTR
jgi:SAM-dependent methyltransferase